MDTDRYWAKRPFDYAGLSLDRGQVFRLVGAANDEKLIRLGYVAPVPKHSDTYECNVCGAQFIGLAERNYHGEKQHPSRPRSPREEDRMLDREERMLEELAPIGKPVARVTRRR